MRGIWVICAVLSAVFVLMGLAGAAGCVNENQTIIRLSSIENAHGAIWNQSYGIKVCYDELFGAKFNGANPHSCSSDSKVLRLYSANNSHAAAKDSTNYLVDVCYGGLGNCTISPGATCDNAGKRAIVYLSRLTNAHLSKSYSAGFYAVCCSKTTGATDISGPINCIEYTSQSECINYNSEVALAGCPTEKNCFCDWNATNGKCLQEYRTETPDCDYKCSMTPINYQTAVCKEDGYKTISVSSEIVPAGDCSTIPQDPDCIDKTIEVPCGLVGFDLPFFGFWQFATSLAGIALVYLVIKRA